jgi:hypothetical protein
LFFQLRIAYLGYSTTQVFYGQQLHFPMTRWQGSDGDHESGKCKEFLSHFLPVPVPVRGYMPSQPASGFSIRTDPPTFAIVRGVGDTLLDLRRAECAEAFDAYPMLADEQMTAVAAEELICQVLAVALDWA